MQPASDAYDAVAYPGFPFPNTHPDRLATMAILHGFSPAPAERCRILEVACNEGANLIPMAYAVPDSEFVGFDLAGLPIERGRARIRELGLINIRLFQSDLLKVGAELGRFDYERETATLLMHLTRAGLIQLHAWKAPVAATISERPRASASARQEARSRPRVSTLLHTTARVDDPVVRTFLCLLDGTRDRPALIDALKAEHPALPDGQIEQRIEPMLKLFHRVGVLEA